MTGRGTTVFQPYSDEKNVYVDVDMTSCEFVKVPNVVISVEGRSSHWIVRGTSSVYNTTNKGFRVYLHNEAARVDKSVLNNTQYLRNIEWVAVGFVC